MVAPHADETLGEAREPISGDASFEDFHTETETRHLRRSRSERVIAGVSGGLGRYLGIDPVLLRLAFIALTFAGGSGILVYFVAWILIPEEKEDEVIAPARPASVSTARIIVGGVLIALGVIFLIERLAPWFDHQVAGALAVISVGAAIVLKGLQR